MYIIYIYINLKLGNKKGTKNFTTPYPVSFLSILHQKKAFHNFHKREYFPIVGRIKGLD